MNLSLFVVDDDPDYADLLAYQLKKIDGTRITQFRSGEDAVAALDLDPDLIFLDVVMPGQGGLEALRRIKSKRPDIPVVMVSAQSVVSVALEAIKLGAFDYVTKGHDDSVKVISIAQRIAEQIELSREVESLRRRIPLAGFDGIVGESEPMITLFDTIRKTLRGDLTVAIVGASGTGKELVAEAIHRNSSRAGGPFVVVNCAAIPRELMESEFFGHEKGSFTGAHARKIGLFEQAHGGTIFLDEIGELDLGLQAKLLRVLQNQQLQRVGGNETIQVDVRVLCATNRDVSEMIVDGSFREDLYYRLFQFPVLLPHLSQRGQDVLLLAEHFRTQYLERHPEIEDRSFSPDARRRMLSYSWPGNVRELKNAVERALLISDGETIAETDLMLGDAMRLVRPDAAKERGPSSDANPARLVASAIDETDIVSMEELKALAVAHAYRVCDGNINKTAERLGVTRSTIYRLMKKHDLAASDDDDDAADN